MLDPAEDVRYAHCQMTKNGLMKSALLLLLKAFLLCSPQVKADEGLGMLSLSDLLLEPTFTYSEGTRGNFSLGASYLEATWRREAMISGVIKIGPQSLIGKPARYSAAASDDVAIIEGFAQADTDWGRVRLGLVPLPFGVEGGDAERRLRFPRSLPYRTGFLGLRDYGFNYRISYEGFFSEWAAHNGEGGANLDDETWFTARWGWQGGRFFRIGFSGATGRTTPRSTNPQGTTLNLPELGLDVNKMARVRIANFFLDWEISPVRLEVEANAADTRQDETDIKFRALRVDLEYQTGASVNLLARYDAMDPRNDVEGDQITELSAGFAWRSQYENSVLYVIGTKRMQQDVPHDVHRGMILWRVTPAALKFGAPL